MAIISNTIRWPTLDSGIEINKEKQIHELLRIIPIPVPFSVLRPNKFLHCKTSPPRPLCWFRPLCLSTYVLSASRALVSLYPTYLENTYTSFKTLLRCKPSKKSFLTTSMMELMIPPLYHLYTLYTGLSGHQCQCSLFTHLSALVESQLLNGWDYFHLCVLGPGQCLTHAEQDAEWVNVWTSRWLKTVVSALLSGYLWCPIAGSYTWHLLSDEVLCSEKYLPFTSKLCLGKNNVCHIWQVWNTQNKQRMLGGGGWRVGGQERRAERRSMMGPLANRCCFLLSVIRRNQDGDKALLPLLPLTHKRSQ